MKIKQIKLTLIRSLCKRLPNHKACASGLGLKRMHQTVTVKADPCNLGMINKIAYMLKIEEL